MPDNLSHKTDQRLSEDEERQISAAIEGVIWAVIALIPFIRVFTSPWGEDPRIFLSHLLGAILISLIILAVPVVSRMIFGAIPLMLIRDAMMRRRAAARAAAPSLRHEPTSDPRELLLGYAVESRLLAQRVYTRSGVYLMFGVFIAIIGLVFFYVRSLSLPPENGLLDRALSLLPGFGILFFIEFGSLFFLRQHRAAMDDFRYFDSVQRHREENLVVLTMFAENTSGVIPTADVIKAMTVYSGSQKLMAGETTEILEARRMQRDDILVFEKLIEAFGAVKEATGSNGKKR